jgi:hypothetical protein
MRRFWRGDAVASPFINYRVSIASATSFLSSPALFGLTLLATSLAGCGNKTARAPVPPTYDWPDSLAYRVRLTWDADRGAEVAARYEEAKQLWLVVRNDRYVVWNDSLERTVTPRGASAQGEPLQPEDTLHYFVRLSRLGEIIESVPDCDPAVPGCGAALPSALPLEMRHVIPRLPLWWPPRGREWTDTLAFDDLPRARGSKGSLVTRYRTARDTVLRGRGYWIVSWTSIRQVVQGDATDGATAAAPVEERGTVFVDKERLVPACAVWSGAAAVSALPQLPGAVRTRLRGRAYLVGSPFDSLVAGR